MFFKNLQKSLKHVFFLSFLLRIYARTHVYVYIICFNNNSANSQPKTFTVEYYDNKTKQYTSEAGANSIQTDFIAPAGKVIKGLFDKNDIQYADYDCVVDLKKTIPKTLYAKYENVDISYYNEDPFSAWDEDPHKISFYSGRILTWEFDPTEYPNDRKMIAACQCNPYADLTITVSFTGKGIGDYKNGNNNEFYSTLIVCDETIADFEAIDLNENYTKFTYSGTIKAKQLTNGNFRIKVKTSASYGYEGYTIKNYKIGLSFNFNV